MTQAESQYLMLPYQRRWLADRSDVKVAEKSRQIGLTWTEASDSVLEAADGTCDTWYIGYTEDQALEFIRDAEGWCRTFNMVGDVADMQKNLWLDDEGNEVSATATDDQSILAFRITFRSGKRIMALSSSPRNLRGKRGKVVLDEFAFHKDAAELLKAAMALLMWGGRVVIISTHNGAGNLFNEITQGIRDGVEQYRDFSLHTTTFDDALEDGLYKRICRKLGKPWSPEAQEQYRETTIRRYGLAGDEELFCIPTQLGAGDYFQRDTIPIVDGLEELGRVGIRRAIRCWDFGATKPNKNNRDPDWTRGALCWQLTNGKHAVASMASLRDGPAFVNELLEATAAADGRDVEVGLPVAPGDAGKADAEAKARALTGYQVHLFRATKDKESYARVWAPIAARGDLVLIRGSWNEEFLRELEAFPGGKHDDQVDPVSMFFQLTIGAPNWEGQGMDVLPDPRRPQAMLGSNQRAFDEPDADADGFTSVGGGMGGGFF